MALVYRARDHSYWRDGTHVVSVTQALKLDGQIDARFYSAEAAARGTAVHEICENADHGRASIIDADLMGYAEAYQAFVADLKPRYTEIERLVYSAALRAAGRPDRIVDEMLGESGVLELKTGTRQDWHAVQLALYQLMRPAGTRWIVYLQKNGRYKGPYRCTASDDYRRGISAVETAWRRADEWQLAA